MIYSQTITRTWVLIESRSGLYWTRLSHFSFTGHIYSLMLIICMNIIKIQPLVHELQLKPFFFFFYNFIFDLDL